MIAFTYYILPSLTALILSPHMAKENSRGEPHRKVPSPKKMKLETRDICTDLSDTTTRICRMSSEKQFGGYRFVFLCALIAIAIAKSRGSIRILSNINNNTKQQY